MAAASLGNYSGSTADRAADRYGARFNKAMRMLNDGSIAFRLYDTRLRGVSPGRTR
jgi:hypothetical protein